MPIRRAKQEDAQSITQIHRSAVMAISNIYSPEEIEAWAIPRPLESCEDSIRSKEFYVAENEGTLLGFAVLNQTSSEVEAVYVRPEEKGRGVGLTLLAKLEQRARELGLKTLQLNASLNAVPFYERAGYIAAQASRYRLFSGIEIACVPMTKTLNTQA